MREKFLIKSIKISTILFKWIPTIRSCSTSKTKTQLDPIQNATLRLITGAFQTRSAIKLCAETGAPPLHYKRLSLTVKFLTTHLLHSKTSVHDHVFYSPLLLNPRHDLRTHLEHQLKSNRRTKLVDCALFSIGCLIPRGPTTIYCQRPYQLGTYCLPLSKYVLSLELRPFQLRQPRQRMCIRVLSLPWNILPSSGCLLVLENEIS